MKLCYGTFATTLNLCALDKRYQSKLNSAMLETIDPHGTSHDEAQASRLFNCKIGLNELDIIDPARSADKDVIAERFEAVFKLLDPNKLKLAVLAIRDIIINDGSIDSDTIIYNKISKQKLINQYEFVKADFFSGVFLYTVCSTKNKSKINFSEEITEDYIAGFKNKCDSIKFIEHDNEPVTTHINKPLYQKSDIWKAVKADYLASRSEGQRFANMNIISRLLPHGYVVHSDFTGYGKTENGDIKPLNDILSDYNADNITIIGEGGIGKTTFLLKTMEEVYQLDYNENLSIPIFIELNHCPAQIGSWYSIKSEKTNYITRSIASLLCGEGLHNIPDDILKFIENEFKKENHQSAEYTILLDGFNEVSLSGAVNSGGEAVGSGIREMLNKEIRVLMHYPNLRIILTSRKTDLAFFPGLTKTIELSGIKPKDIEIHLQENGYIQWDINHIISSHKLMDCLRIPLFLCMFTAAAINKSGINSEYNPETRGEILYYFFNRSEGTYNERLNAERLNPISIFAKKEMLFILDFVLPYLGRTYEYTDFISMDRCSILEYIENFFNGEEEITFWNKKIPVFSDYESETSCLADYKDKILARGCEAVLDCIVNVLGAMNRDNNFNYLFIHHHVRDYFAAIYEIQRMRMAIKFCDINRITEAFASLSLINENVWSVTKRVFIGEILSEHRNAPKPDGTGKWELPLPHCKEQGILRSILHIFRRAQMPTYCGVLNVIETLKSVRGTLAGEDFSALSMVEARLHGVNCSLGRNSNVLAANFRDTKISDDVFETEGHIEDIIYFAYSKDSDYLFTMSEDDIVKRWETDTGRCINTIKIECSKMSENSLLAQTYFAVSNDGEAFLTIGFEPLKDKSGHLCFIQQYDWKNHRVVYESIGDFHDVNTMSFSIDDQYVAVVYTHNNLRIYKRGNPKPIFSKTLDEVGNVIEALIIKEGLVLLLYTVGDVWWHEGNDIDENSTEEIVYNFAVFHTEKNELDILYTYSAEIDIDDDDEIKQAFTPLYTISSDGKTVIFSEKGLLRKLDIPSKAITDISFDYEEPNFITFIPRTESFFAFYFDACIRYDHSADCETGRYCYDGLTFQVVGKDSSLHLLMFDDEMNVYELNLLSDSIRKKYQYCKHTITDIFLKANTDELIITFDNDSLWIINQENGALLETICYQEADAKSCLSCFSMSSDEMIFLFVNDNYEYLRCYNLATGESKRTYFDFTDKRKIRNIFISENDGRLICVYEQSIAEIDLDSLIMTEFFQAEDDAVIQDAYYCNVEKIVKAVISYPLLKPRMYGFEMNDEGFYRSIYWYELPYLDESILKHLSPFYRVTYMPVRIFEENGVNKKVYHLSSGLFLEYDQKYDADIAAVLHVDMHLLCEGEKIINAPLDQFKINYVIGDSPSVLTKRIDEDGKNMPPICQLLDVSDDGKTVAALSNNDLLVYQFHNERFTEVCRFSSSFEDVFTEAKISGAKIGDNGAVYYWINENKLYKLDINDGRNKMYEGFIPGLSVMGCDFQDADMSTVTRFMLALHGGVF